MRRPWVDRCIRRTHWLLYELLAGRAVCADDFMEQFDCSQSAASDYLRAMSERYELDEFRSEGRKYFAWPDLEVEVHHAYHSDTYRGSETDFAVDRLDSRDEPPTGDD